MRSIVIVFFTFVLHKPILGQSIIKNDTCDKNYKIDQGKLRRFNLLDNGTYFFVTSKHYSFIEFTFLSWGTRLTKYRVAKTLDDQIYIVTKTISKTDLPLAKTYVAIDSTTFNKIEGNRKGFDYLKKEKVCEKLSDADLELFSAYSYFIKQHNLQTEFPNFQPTLSVAWLEIKD